MVPGLGLGLGLAAGWGRRAAMGLGGCLAGSWVSAGLRARASLWLVAVPLGQ